MKRFAYTLFLLVFSPLLFAQAKVITYPAPVSERMNTSYDVFVNGQKLDIYRALSPKFVGGEYYFCYFDFEGEVEVKVKTWKTFTKQVSPTKTQAEKDAAAKLIVGEILPRWLNAKVSRNEATFKANKPFKAIVVRNKTIKPLIIFGNSIEKNPPKKSDKNVVYFGAGVHYLDKQIELKDNQILYIAGGAVVKAPVFANGAKNVKICGRGVISLDNFERWSVGCMNFVDCKNLEISGVILKDTVNWSVVFRDCDNVKVDNFKLCTSRMINDDAFDICNSTNVSITNTFARCEDDVIAIKGIYGGSKDFFKIRKVGYTNYLFLENQGMERALKGDVDWVNRMNNRPVENIFIRDCIFWTDSANIFRIGYECCAPYFKNLRCENLFVPFYAPYRDPKIGTWSHAIVNLQAANEMPILDMHFENITINSNGKDMVLLNALPRDIFYAEQKGYGRIENISIKNIIVEGLKSYKKETFNGEICIIGKDSSHDVKNVKVENLTYFGEKKTPENLKIHIGDYASGIDILGKKK